MVKGIDVSKWQGGIDWKKAADAGIRFAMVRTGYGSSYLDPYFHANVRGAQAAGIDVGVYHYSYALTPEQAKTEAAFVLETIKGYKLEYPVAFDAEDPSMSALTKAWLTEICMAFCLKIEEAGYWAMLYSSTSWLQNRLDMSRLNRFSLWRAHWSANRPADMGEAMWQHSNTGAVAGISGNVDLNWSYVDFAAVIKARGLNGFAAQPAPPPEPQPQPEPPADGARLALEEIYRIAGDVLGR